LSQMYELSGAPLTVQVVGGKLLLWGAKEDVELIQKLLEQADQTVPKTTRFIPLKNAQAKEVAKSISDVFNKIAQRPGVTQVRDEEKVDVIADNRSNSLIIVATEEAMARAVDLVQQIDSTASDVKRMVRPFFLVNRLAKDVKPVLEQVVQNMLKRVGAEQGQ